MGSNQKKFNRKIESQDEYLELIRDFLGLQSLPEGYKIPKPVIFLHEIKRVENPEGLGADITYSDPDAHVCPILTTRVWLFDYQWSQSKAGRAAKKSRRIKQKSRKILAKSAHGAPIATFMQELPQPPKMIQNFLMRERTLDVLDLELNH